MMPYGITGLERVNEAAERTSVDGGNDDTRGFRAMRIAAFMPSSLCPVSASPKHLSLMELSSTKGSLVHLVHIVGHCGHYLRGGRPSKIWTATEDRRSFALTGCLCVG